MPLIYDSSRSVEIYRFQGVWVASITLVVLFVRIQKDSVVAFPVGSHVMPVGPEMTVNLL